MRDMHSTRQMCCWPALMCLLGVASGATGQFEIKWFDEYEPSSYNVGTAAAIDGGGNVYFLGNALGNADDAFLRKYDTTGNVVWTRTIATSRSDTGADLYVDADGRSLVVGDTQGQLGGPSVGGPDVYFRRFSPSGEVELTLQFGTSGTDYARAIVGDDQGNVYVAWDTHGQSVDATLSKFDARGTLLWSRELVTPEFDWSQAVTLDGAGSVYLVGFTGGNLAGPGGGTGNAYLCRLTVSGDLVWCRQFSEGDARAQQVATDSSGNVYVSGEIVGTSNFLVKFDSDGNLAWSTPEAGSVFVDQFNGVYMSGSGAAGLFVNKFDTDGSFVYGVNLGLSFSVTDVAGDTRGRIGVAGYTQGRARIASLGPSCFADCNLTGELDVFDFLCFQDAFVAGDPYADCDGNAVLDVFDFLCFQDAFTIGCP